MLWVLMAVLAVAGAILSRRRSRPDELEIDEPWHASLEPEADLDMEEIRKAEDEWLAEESWSSEDEPWR